jgi:phosphopantothenoylcysteine synthetase/decarboxylase
MNDAGKPVVYVIACGAPPTREVGKLVDIAKIEGWDVCVITSLAGRKFIDADAISTKTGHTVRSDYKQPGTPDVLPPADAMIVAPATCNTMAKWSAGISDSLPLGLLVEAVGKHLPTVCMPFSNRAQLSFPAIQEAMQRLAEWGVTVLGPDVYTPHEPGTGGKHVHLFPWRSSWEALLQHPWLSAAPAPRD